MLNDIMEKFETFMMAPSVIDQYQEVGRIKLLEKIIPKVNANQPLDFVMLGFPMKSPNSRDKVIGKLPDLAEEMAFKNFAKFDEEIKKIYKPGTKITLASDGYVFNDIMGVEDNTVAEYEEVSVDMLGGTTVEWMNLRNFYNKDLSMRELRDKVILQHGITDEVLQQRILLDPDTNALYKGMIRFLTLDLAIQEFPSANQLQKKAKIVAREMMYRNEAYSQLVTSEFKSAIRLSMHPSQNNGNKYSFQLIPSPKAWTSPWHCALAVDSDGQFETIHRKDAIAAGYELIEKDGRPYFFVQNN